MSFNLPFGVYVAGDDHLDLKYEVADEAAMHSLLDAGLCKEGHTVYRKDLKQKFCLTGPTNADWRPEAGGFKIKGTKNNVGELPSTGNNDGDTYIVGGNGFTWTSSGWKDIGPLVGPKGDTGAPGERGPKGDMGDQGPQGPVGPKGDQGAPGPKGDTGEQGPTGPKGDRGEQGPAGIGINIKGTLTSISQLPATGNKEGDTFIIDGDAHNWTGDSWVNIGRIQGPKGDQGEQGPRGLQGLQGPKGDQGPAGPQGIQGLQGPRGAQGPVGETGPQGPAGPQGPKGDKGDKGDNGGEPIILYTSLEQALQSSAGSRYIGLTLRVSQPDGSAKEYWFETGTGDGDLKEKHTSKLSKDDFEVGESGEIKIIPEKMSSEDFEKDEEGVTRIIKDKLSKDHFERGPEGEVRIKEELLGNGNGGAPTDIPSIRDGLHNLPSGQKLNLEYMEGHTVLDDRDFEMSGEDKVRIKGSLLDDAHFEGDGEAVPFRIREELLGTTGPGTPSDIPMASPTQDGKMSKENFAKLRDIEPNATADQTKEEIRDLIHSLPDGEKVHLDYLEGHTELDDRDFEMSGENRVRVKGSLLDDTQFEGDGENMPYRIKPELFGSGSGTGGAVSSVNGKTGAVTITKEDLNIGNVDNTSDAEKPVSNPQREALDQKVDKQTGKGLSTEDFTTALKEKLEDIEENATADQTGEEVRDLLHDLPEGTRFHLDYADGHSKLDEEHFEGTGDDSEPFKIRLDPAPVQGSKNLLNSGSIYAALRALPIIPAGLRGQILVVAEDNTDRLVSSDIMNIGNFITTDEQLETLKLSYVGQEEMFSSWFRFSHGKGTSSDVSSIAKTDELPGIPRQTNSWFYEPETQRVRTNENTASHIGFVSDQRLDRYTSKVTITATDNDAGTGADHKDNDRIGIVIAFIEDPEDLVPNKAFGMDPTDFSWPIDTTSTHIPNQHTLTVFRNRELYNPTVDERKHSFFVIYNFGKLDQRIIAFNDDPWVAADGHTTSTSWSWSGAEADLQVIRDGDRITITTSDFSDAPGGKGEMVHRIDLDLNDHEELKKFRGPARFGYSVQSQTYSSFLDITISNTKNEIYDLRNGDVWVANSDGQYIRNINRNVYSEVSPRTFVYNELYGSLAYILPGESYIAISTGGGGSLSMDPDHFDGDGEDVPYRIKQGLLTGAVTSVAGKTGAVTLVKADVGLNNVNNTADLNKPVSHATQTELDKKVDKEAGKGLSTEDFTSGLKDKLENIEEDATADQTGEEIRDLLHALEGEDRFDLAYTKGGSTLDEEQFEEGPTGSFKIATDPFPVAGSKRMVNSGSLFNAMALAMSMVPDSTTRNTSVIRFDKPAVYGTSTNPITENLTEDNTGSSRVIQVIFHKAASLVVPSTWKRSKVSSDYDPSKTNVIYIEHYSNSYKRYTIDQDD